MDKVNITRETRRPITDEIKEFAREWEWGEFEIEHGYGYFETNKFDHDGVTVHSRHIEVIGDMDVFDSDMEAALYAEKFYMEKIFHYDVDDGEPGAENLKHMWFVDDPETRKAVEDYLARKFGPDHGFTPDYETVERFVGKFPKSFVYQNLADEADREVFTIGAIDNQGQGYYLSDCDGFVRSVGNEVGEYDLNGDGVVEYNEFALNGLFFEFNGETGKLNRGALAALMHPDTVFYDYRMVNFGAEHLTMPGAYEGVERYYNDTGDLRGALFLKALDEYIENPDDAVFHEATRKHADEFIYCYENGKELIDLDFWCDYQDLLGDKITYDEYVAIDKHLDGAPCDYTQEDVEVVSLLKGKLAEYRSKGKGLDSVLENAEERSEVSPGESGKAQEEKELG